MLGAEQVLRSAYYAFNARDVYAAIALMQPEVDWPSAWEGGRVSGRAAVRDFWNGVVEATRRGEPYGDRCRLHQGRRGAPRRQHGAARWMSVGELRLAARNFGEQTVQGAPHVARAAVNYFVGAFWVGESSSNGTPMARTCGAVDVQLLGYL